MQLTLPQYLLITEVNPSDDEFQGGHWRFLLQRTGSRERLDADGEESGIGGERLQLLAVVRGLEAIPEPARVTLLTSSRHIGRGVRVGLAEWKESNWRWERFGEMAPVKNCDLWQRIDKAMQIHSVECRIWHGEQAAAAVAENSPGSHRRQPAPPRIRAAVRQWAGNMSAGLACLTRAGQAASL